jgi:hypothetical protein
MIPATYAPLPLCRFLVSGVPFDPLNPRDPPRGPYTGTQRPHYLRPPMIPPG